MSCDLLFADNLHQFVAWRLIGGGIGAASVISPNNLILSKDTRGSCGRACRSEVMDSGNRHSGIGGGWQREASLRARLQELASNRVQSAANEFSGRITHLQSGDADLWWQIIGRHPHCS